MDGQLGGTEFSAVAMVWAACFAHAGAGTANRSGCNRIRFTSRDAMSSSCHFRRSFCGPCHSLTPICYASVILPKRMTFLSSRRSEIELGFSFVERDFRSLRQSRTPSRAFRPVQRLLSSRGRRARDGQTRLTSEASRMGDIEVDVIR